MEMWADTLLPIGTLIIGSLLTMGGQALHDRRMADKEKQARREAFRSDNFEIHRAAMLEMQEVLSDGFGLFIGEKCRREEEEYYAYFDSKPWQKALDFKHELAIGMQMAELSKHLVGASDQERAEAAADLLEGYINQAGGYEEFIRRLEEMYQWETEMVQRMRVLTESRIPFSEKLASFFGKLRICMYRSGSNSVVFCGQNLIEAIYKWDCCIREESAGELADQVRAARFELDRAISNALTFGPYDTYKSKPR